MVHYVFVLTGYQPNLTSLILSTKKKDRLAAVSPIPISYFDQVARLNASLAA